MSLEDLLRVGSGAVDLSTLPSDATPGFEGGKKHGLKALDLMASELELLQTKLAANGYVDGTQKILLVLQGMDTSGKGGVLSHLAGLFDPAGLHIKSFKKPTDEELSHDFLWRIEKEAPEAGKIGIFDRSHYEDVLVVRVHQFAPADEVERRYGAINDFEKKLADNGTTIVKCMLHISYDEQKQRLLDRLDDPAKNWKYKPGDVNERQLWPAYMDAYQIALERCSTDVAPWYVVPSDRKWYQRWAIGTLLLEAMQGMNLDWPAVDYDVEAEKKRVAAT